MWRLIKANCQFWVDKFATYMKPFVVPMFWWSSSFQWWIEKSAAICKVVCIALATTGLYDITQYKALYISYQLNFGCNAHQLYSYKRVSSHVKHGEISLVSISCMATFIKAVNLLFYNTFHCVLECLYCLGKL